MCRRLLVTSIFLAVSSTVLLAQGTSTVRSEIQQFVRAYVNAQNKSDIAATMEMVSRKPGVSSVGMGKILRGWDSIRAEVDEGIGSSDHPKMILGTIDVQPLGTSYGLTVAPFSATFLSPQGEIQIHGAITLVVEKSAGKWKVLHEHTSIQVPRGPEGD